MRASPHPCPALAAAALRAAIALALGLALGDATATSCVDETQIDARPAAPAAPPEPAPTEPRARLQGLVRDALIRSQSVGAARLLTEAAQQDSEATRAAKDVQASFNGGLGPSIVNSDGVTEHTPTMLRGVLSVSQLIYDGGRTDRLVDWRRQIAEAARLGQLNLQEQLALNTVVLTFERSRFRLQAQVYGQYVRKMACLVEALEQIVAADRGRLSELVQAQKTLQQAELSQVESVSSARQVEVRLRRLVGDGLPTIEGMASVMLAVPDLPTLQTQAERSSEIAQLDAQTASMNEYARAVEAGRKPQLSWTIGGTQTSGLLGGNAARATGLTAGVTINVPLIDPAIGASIEAARKRAQAAALQRADALESRVERLNQTYEQATASFDRMRRLGDVLRNSERVRTFTLQQWQQLGKRSLFDVMAAEGDHYAMRIAHVNALHDGQQMNAILQSLGPGLLEWLR